MVPIQLGQPCIACNVRPSYVALNCLPTSEPSDFCLEAFLEVVFRIANWPVFHWDLSHEGVNTNTSYGLEEILQDPCEARASELYSRLCIYFEKLNLELQRCVFDEKVNTVEFKSVGYWLLVDPQALFRLNSLVKTNFT
jgi:hypothetical protein